MNKIYKLAALLSVCLMAFAGCAPEELSTDQLSDENVTFAAMAPNPVARGGALRIQGSNLDKVTEVRIPGVEPITGEGIIQVDSLKGRLSEIRVIVPVDGPEVGKVVIVDQDGNEFSSHADLTYSEPIIFTSFSTPNEVAFPGDVVTVKGDYMNNIRAIQFGSSKAVTVFEEQSRYELKVVVPADAVTGKVILCDVDENNNPDGNISNLFYSEKDLTIGKPTVDAKDRGVLKAGETIKVTGKYLQMIKEAKFKYTAYDKDGNPYDAYENVDLVLAEDTKSVSVVLSATVTDGELLLYSYAGDEFKTGAFKTLVPSELKHSAAKGYKAGNEVVITGKDLDLVTGIKIGEEAVAEFTSDKNGIKFNLSATVKDGDLIISLANGKTEKVGTKIEMVKPTITALSATQIMAGESLEIEGTDLDLVTKVVLKDKACEFKYDETTKKITVTTANTSQTGKVTIETQNGTTVVSEAEVVIEYDSLVIVTTLTTSASIGDEVTMTGANFNMIEAIYFGDVKVTGYTKRADDEMTFVIPTTVDTGTYQIKFLLTTGEEETCPASIEVKGAITTVVVWEGRNDLGSSWDWNMVVNLQFGSDWGVNKFSKLPYGAAIHVEFEPAPETGGQLKLISSDLLKCFPGNEWGVVEMKEGTTHASYVLTDEDVVAMNTSGFAACGQNLVITKVYYTYENTDADPIFVSDIMINDFDQHGNHNAGWDSSWNGGPATGKMDGSDGYLEITSSASGWLINCNHQSDGQLTPKVDDTSKYNLKFDILVPSGSTIEANSLVMQVIFNDKWYWVGNISNQEIVGKDKWATIMIDFSNATTDGGATPVPASLDMSTGAQGLSLEGSGALLPIGAKIDNFRFSLK